MGLLALRLLTESRLPGPFQIQAAIAAVHAAAPTGGRRQIHGSVEGLDALAEIDPVSLENYHPYHAARVGLLARAGRRDEALDAYKRAVELTTNPVERAFLVRQRAAL